jgi:hypothetical protein
MHCSSTHARTPLGSRRSSRVRGPVAAAVVTIAVLVAAGCGQSTLDSKAVRTQAASVRSLAVEGGVLVDGMEHDGLKESFAQVHAADLADRAADSEQQLEPSLATPKLKRTVERLRAMAEAVSTELRGIETDPREATVTRRAARRLERLASGADAIESRL